MNKEPIGLYIFRFILGFGLFAFMGMLYWSSLLLEQQLEFQQSNFSDLKKEVAALRTDTNRSKEDILQAISVNESSQSTVSTIQIKQIKNPKNHLASADLKHRPQIDPSLPNLLVEDPFYETTLPKLLGNNFTPHGTLHFDELAKPDNLHPFSNWKAPREWMGLCIPSLAGTQFGKPQILVPGLAIKIECRPIVGNSDCEFWVHLRDNVFWQPLSPEMFTEHIDLAPQFLEKHQVTSEDFKFYYDALTNPFVQESGAVALRTLYDDMLGIEIIDKLTFKVKWKSKKILEPNGQSVEKIKFIAPSLTGGLTPLASFVYKYFSDGKKIVEDDSAIDTYLKDSVWAQNFTQHWAKNIILSCGGYVFEGMTDRRITFRRNIEYYNPLDVLVEGRIDEFKDALDGVWQDFKAGKIDAMDLQPDQLIELDDFLHSKGYAEQAQKGKAINRLDYTASQFGYIGWNEAKPYFKSKKVRQALTMAIDRKRIINQNLNGMGIEITGPFSPFSSSYDKSIVPYPFDMQKARQFLEEEGWFDSKGEGVIGKMIDGKWTSFQFSLTYYVKNSKTKAICEYVATSFKELGIVCNLNGVDVADLSAVFDDKNFDSLCMSWITGAAPEDPKQLWSSAGAKEKGSSNAIGFVNKEVDDIIDKLEYEDDQKVRLKLYHRFDAIIHDEAPYTFLYTPKFAYIYREYVHNVFVPTERPDLVPGAEVAEPQSSVFTISQ